MCSKAKGKCAQKLKDEQHHEFGQTLRLLLKSSIKASKCKLIKPEYHEQFRINRPHSIVCQHELNLGY